MLLANQTLINFLHGCCWRNSHGSKPLSFSLHIKLNSVKYCVAVCLQIVFSTLCCTSKIHFLALAFVFAGVFCGRSVMSLGLAAAAYCMGCEYLSKFELIRLLQFMVWKPFRKLKYQYLYWNDKDRQTRKTLFLGSENQTLLSFDADMKSPYQVFTKSLPNPRDYPLHI